MELIIIRHAQSTNNTLADPRDRDRDAPLTELGTRQAQIVAQHLATGTSRVPWKSDQRGYGITRLYCSPMWRSLQTTQFIGQALGLAPEVWVDVHEHGGIYLDQGEEEGLVGYPGKTRQEILAEFPHYVLPEGITEQGWWNQGYEDVTALRERAIRVAEELRKRAIEEEERIAVVSHAGFINALLKALLNQWPIYHFWYHHYNAAISRIDFHSDDHLEVQFLNRVDHLPPEMVS
jgi:2,3-bisphosphoglycerate-dependent phosphoglycerate mutase